MNPMDAQDHSQTPGPPSRLKPCPQSPNCVCSQAESARHRIEPLPTGDHPDETFAALKKLLSRMPGTRIRSESATYLHAEARTKWLRFVDDLECLLDVEQRCIHIRSASRLGYSDLGANRRRVESIRTQLEQQLAQKTR